MIGSKRALPFAAVLLAASFAAEATQTSYAFVAVTGVQYVANASITGVLAGDTVVRTVALPLSGTDSCANLVFATLSNPETYTLTITIDTETDPTGITFTTLVSCRLDRNPSVFGARR